MLCFHLYEQIDYDADMTQVIETLEGNEQILYEVLLKRGASFMPALSGTLGGESPHETLMELSVKGLSMRTALRLCGIYSAVKK